ncbi:hypothetical protein ENBRE01_1492 [Enteropsectra breve]|nr:hypothetical protein ENBRE01_1492 [Enteropsectra breve]
MHSAAIMTIIATACCMPLRNEQENPNTDSSAQYTPSSSVPSTSERETVASSESSDTRKRNERKTLARINQIMEQNPENDMVNLLSNCKFEPLAPMTDDQSIQLFENIFTKLNCRDFILDSSGIYDKIVKNEDLTNKHILSLYKYNKMFPYKYTQVSPLTVFENGNKALNSFNEMVELAIKKMSVEDERIADFFKNILEVGVAHSDGSSGNVKAFEFSTINFNNAMNCEVPEDMDMETICLDSLGEEADVKCFVETEKSLRKDSEIEYSLSKQGSKIIIITADQYIKKIRDAGKELPLEFTLTKGRDTALTYRVKAVVFREKVMMGEFSTSLIKASELDIFGEEGKTILLKKLLINPISIMYERID